MDCLNKLQIKLITQASGWKYSEVLIDDTPLASFLFGFTHNEHLKGLAPAWFSDLESVQEQEYIKECVQTESQEGIAVPVLLCPEDLDLWCIVVVAKVRFTIDCVIWDKIGIVKKDNWNTDHWVNSGIRDFENWTDEEWNLYGSTFDLFDLNDKSWDLWISQNWPEEEKRRLNNYTHQYYNNDQNIDWLDGIPQLIFNRNQYVQALCVT